MYNWYKIDKDGNHTKGKDKIGLIEEIVQTLIKEYNIDDKQILTLK